MNRRSFFRSLAAALISVPLARMVGAEIPDRYSRVNWKEVIERCVKMFRDARDMQGVYAGYPPFDTKQFQAKIDSFSDSWRATPIG